MEKEVVLTPEGLKKIQAELEYLRTVKRKEVADRIREALDFGDPWENPEYESAKNEQAFVEGRILTLEKMLQNVRVVAGEDVPHNVVSVGTRVRMRDLESGDEVEYTIVGAAEADPAQARISYESPVAQALLGHKVGDRVRIEVPAGALEYEILGVQGAEA